MKYFLTLFFPCVLWAQKPEAGDAQKHVELNLLGKEDAAKGESRRNENIQFNLVDNNALKELNVRLGATATLVEEFRADRGYFGAEFGTPAPGPIALAAQRRAGWHGNLFANHQNSVFSARAFFQVGDVKPARENRYGFQSGGNLFAHGYEALARLHSDLVEELQRYRAALAPADMALAGRWPAKMRLHGWFVRLVTGGHQQSHNHPFGWMSGCLYLQMPAHAAPGEGAIEFGLDSGGYPQISDRQGPTVLHQPKPGQVAFFPSSAYHRTIPFRSDEERLCIAFDLLPE